MDDVQGMNDDVLIKGKSLYRIRWRGDVECLRKGGLMSEIGTGCSVKWRKTGSKGDMQKHILNTIDESFKVSKGSRITRVISY